MSQKENILAIHSGHDASVCLWNDYNQIAIYKEERLNRKKNWGQAFPLLSFNKITFFIFAIIGKNRFVFIHN